MLEYLFYSILLGAVVFGATRAVTKNNGIAWLVSIALGVVAILFFFGDAKTAKTLGDIANNITLLIFKAVCAVGWLTGTWGAFWLASKLKPS